MATDFVLQVAHDPSEIARVGALLDRAHAQVRALEAQLSEFIPTSPVAVFNASKAGEWVPFTEDAFLLLMHAIEISELTRNSFHPFAKSFSKNRKIKPSTPILHLIDIEISKRQIRKKRTGAHLGFGAIGKGFALDLVSQVLETAGYDHYLLNAGGSSIISSGFKDGQSLRWELAWGWDRDDERELIGSDLKVLNAGQKLCIGVSGTMEQGAHIVSSHGASKEKYRSVFLSTRSATLADALSTAVFVGGEQILSRSLKKIGQVPAIAAIDTKSVPSWNQSFQDVFKLPKGWVAGTITGLAWLAFGLTAIPLAQAQEESIDLSAMSSGFSPYLFDRSEAWIALPVLTFFWLLLHLRKPPLRNRRKLSLPNEWNKKENANEPQKS